MGALRCAGLFALVPTALLLSVSFFVLLAARKADSKGLKSFGLAVAVLLWISAALVVITGIYALLNPGSCVPPNKRVIRGGVNCPFKGKGPMGGGQPGMMDGRQMPVMDQDAD